MNYELEKIDRPIFLLKAFQHPVGLEPTIYDFEDRRFNH